MTGTATEVHRIWAAPDELASENRREFTAMLRYCITEATVYKLLGGDRPQVEFSTADSAVADRIERLLEEAFRRFGGSVKRRNRTKLDQWELSVQPGGIPQDDGRIGPGLFVGGPKKAKLIRALDRLFGDMATRLGADEYTVPALVPWSTLEKADYTHNFPQHVTAGAVVRSDLDALDRFSAAQEHSARVAELEMAPVVLAPAVCLSLFERFGGVDLTEPLTVTATGKCSRYEGQADTSPTRLWSFSMREIVYIGDRPSARAFREAVLEELVSLATELAMPCRVVPAGDPFFTKERPQQADYQAAMDVKYELVGRLSHDDSGVAIASLNYHNQHFGKGFDIGFAGQPAFSVCLGFGLERWAEWLSGYLSDDPADWPDVLRDRC